MTLRSILFVLFYALLIIPSVPAQEWVSGFDQDIIQANQFLSVENYENAIIELRSAYSTSKSNGDTLRVLKSGILLGETYNDFRDFENASIIGEEIEPYFHPKWGDSLLIDIKYFKRLALFNLSKHHQAIEELYALLALVDSAKNLVEYGSILNTTGSQLLYLGEYERSIIYRQRALAISEQIGEEEGINIRKRSLYISYLYNGDLETGEQYLFEFCEYAEEVQQLDLLFDCNYYLGDYYVRRHNYSKAIVLIEKSLRVAQATKNKRSLSLAYRDLGELYLDTKDFESSLAYLNRFLTLSEELGRLEEAFYAKELIGEIYYTLGDYEQSELILSEVLSFYQHSGSYLGHIGALIRMTQVQLNKNDQATALVYLEQAQKLSTEKNVPHAFEWILQRYLVLDEEYVSNEEKLSLAKEMYAYASSIDERARLNSMRFLSEAYYKTNSDSAFIVAEEALALIEDQRVTIAESNFKLSAFSEFSSFYNRVGSWYASSKNNYNRAFELFESSKSRALLDQLAEKNAQDLLLISKEDEFQLLQYQKTIDQLYRSKSSANAQELQQISAEIADTELRYQVALENIKSNHPEWNSFVYPEVISLNEAQKMIDSETGIIHYALLREGIALMLITRNEVLYHEVIVGRNFDDHLSELVGAFRNRIIEKVPIDSLSSTSEELYSYLFDPISSELEPLENLIVIPDGSIALIPLDAIVHEGEFLAEQYLIKTLPSLSVYKYINEPFRETPNTFMGIAGSGFESPDQISGSSAQRGYATLPFTLIEVDSLAAKFSDPFILQNEAVSEVSIKNSELGNFRYLHFATHGDINEISPSQSGLILSKMTDMESLFGEDGLFNATEISSLNLNADMVVLSACNTANGKVINGEGLLGLQRSFLVAGASSVVSSLWSIYDRSTPIFMNIFYDYVQEFEEEEISWFDNILLWADLYNHDIIDYKSKALHQTKLDMMEHPYYNHPVHWASFVITGK